MSEALPIIYLARHGETDWSLSGQHTGRTDLPLTERGERNARRLGERLRGLTFARVFTSPLQRAARTCELAGFRAMAEIDVDLLEWDYGTDEGRKTAEIRAHLPGWTIWHDGPRDGETALHVRRRVDRVIARVRATDGDTLAFAHGHVLRALTARWLGLPVRDGRLFELGTASVSVLGWEREQPTIERWNVSTDG